MMPLLSLKTCPEKHTLDSRQSYFNSPCLYLNVCDYISPFLFLINIHSCSTLTAIPEINGLNQVQVIFPHNLPSPVLFRFVFPPSHPSYYFPIFVIPVPHPLSLSPSTQSAHAGDYLFLPSTLLYNIFITLSGAYSVPLFIIIAHLLFSGKIKTCSCCSVILSNVLT